MHLLAWPLVRSHGYTSSRCISGFFDPFNKRSHTLHSLTNILAANQYSPCLSHTTLTTRTALAFGVRGWDQLTIFVKWLGLQLRGTWLQGEPMKGNFHKNLSRPSPPIALSRTPLVLVSDGDDW